MKIGGRGEGGGGRCQQTERRIRKEGVTPTSLEISQMKSHESTEVTEKR